MNVDTRLVLVAVLLATTAICCAPPAGPIKDGGPSTPPRGIAAGGFAPDFTGRDIDGKNITLSSHLGREVVLLDFYSTWCEPCVAEFPHLKALYQQNRARGFVIFAISVDGPETVANVPGFARRNQLDFPMLMDQDSRISVVYNPKKTAPLSVLIDRSGTIVLIHEGYTPGDEELLAKEVARALGGPSVPL